MKLKNCPFCGSKCFVAEIEVGDSSIFYSVRCIEKNHQLDHLADSAMEAIKVWNERPKRKRYEKASF